jgi:predicted ester cyclase
MKNISTAFILASVAACMLSCTDAGSSSALQKLQAQDSLENRNMEIVKNFYSYLDKQDTAALDKVVAKDFALYFGSSEQPVIFEQLKPLVKSVYTGFPDYKHELEIILASGDYVTSKLKYTGTHLNTYMDIKPTGKKVTYKGIFIFKIENGLITEMHGMEDNLATLIKMETK